jgi:hypothetical protein
MNNKSAIEFDPAPYLLGSPATNTQCLSHPSQEVEQTRPRINSLSSSSYYFSTLLADLHDVFSKWGLVVQTEHVLVVLKVPFLRRDLASGVDGARSHAVVQSSCYHVRHDVALLTFPTKHVRYSVDNNGQGSTAVVYLLNGATSSHNRITAPL